MVEAEDNVALRIEKVRRSRSTRFQLSIGVLWSECGLRWYLLRTPRGLRV